MTAREKRHARWLERTMKQRAQGEERRLRPASGGMLVPLDVQSRLLEEFQPRIDPSLVHVNGD